jgi:hypothetical protein
LKCNVFSGGVCVLLGWVLWGMVLGYVAGVVVEFLFSDGEFG